MRTVVAWSLAAVAVTAWGVSTAGLPGLGDTATPPARVHVLVDPAVEDVDADRLTARLETTPTHTEAVAVRVLAAVGQEDVAAVAGALADAHGASALVLTPSEVAGAAADPHTDVVGAVDAAVRVLADGGDEADAAVAFAAALPDRDPDRGGSGSWWVLAAVLALAGATGAAAVTWPRLGRHRRARPGAGRHRAGR